MIKELITSLLLILVFCASAHAKVFNAQSTKLDNGLEVVVIPNHRAPIVYHMLWYKVGSSQELSGESGSAHFLEHLLFKGTQKQEPGEFSRVVRRLGGEDNAFTSYDYTAYHQMIAKEHLPRMMELEADRMRNANAPEKEVLSEREVVLEERRQRTDNNPQAKFFEQLRSYLFPGHPYGKPVIGWMDEVSGLERDQALAFYNEWYTPSNAILVISGDVTLEEILTDIKETYGQVKGDPAPEKTYPVIPDFKNDVRLEASDPQVKERLFAKGYRAPVYTKDKTASLAMSLLDDILGGGPSARLYKAIVIEQKKAVSASFSYNADYRDIGSAWFTAVPTEGTDFKELENAFISELEKLVEDGLNEGELSESKTRLKNAAIYARDSLGGPARIIGGSLATGSTLDEVETWPEQIMSITEEDIITTARNYLIPGQSNTVTGTLVPATPPLEDAEKLADDAGDKE
ncbi:MAG: peptidase M16 [Alphaproteobacteria bacterium]|nr:peptidase M16 [Alphaproteobacteria bacterium]